MEYITLISIEEEVTLFKQLFDLNSDQVLACLQGCFEDEDLTLEVVLIAKTLPEDKESVFYSALDWIEFVLDTKIIDLELPHSDKDLFISVLSDSLILVGTKPEVLSFRKKLHNRELND